MKTKVKKVEMVSAIVVAVGIQTETVVYEIVQTN